MKNIVVATFLLVSQITFAQELVLEPISGLEFEQPVEISATSIADDDRLFVVEKKGRIFIVENASTDSPSKVDEPFLDLTNKVNSASEGGLLGLAFSPEYALKGYFFVHYTFTNSTSGQFSSRISRFNVSEDDPTKADPSSEVVVLTVAQNEQNHNGGDIVFGPDNMLYVAFGDGGGANDEYFNGQNPQTFLGKILRIDVKTLPYNIPIGNPYDGNDIVLDEIWAVGLRNPWRISFDRLNGDFWISDVGQDQYEEINYEKSGSMGAFNYGWNCYEGPIIFDPLACVTPIEHTEPVYHYSHALGPKSVTGGFVYRGARHPDLYGKYVFTDFVDNKSWWIISDIDNEVFNTEKIEITGGDIPAKVTTFGEGNDGELYFATLDDGRIWRLRTTVVASLDQVYHTNYELYPNPLNDKLTIEKEQYEEIEYIIQDSFGKVITLGNLKSSNTINLEGMSTGIYFITIKTKEHIQVDKLIKVN